MMLEPRPPQYAKVARLTWTEKGKQHTAVIDRASVIGAAPNVDVVLGDPAVSRLHAEIEPLDDGVWIRDLRSKNGTFVQGLRIESVRVPHDGKVRVGGVELTVTYGAAAAPPELWHEPRFGPLLGQSRAMRELFVRLAKVAPSDASVLIGGETGTGKELVARAIHEASPRADKPLVVVDCAALPENLLDAELFGHTKGAFTGAVAARAGAIEAADGGTVFLDEIGELPRSMQPKLLRVLEARTVRRIGESTHRPVDVRFISATHRDLLTMVSAGDFREDLYFRLAVLPVRLPALRERVDDLEMLFRHFWGESKEAISPELLSAMRSRPWRGNVRELRNFVEQARALGAEEALATGDVAPSSDVAPAPAPAEGDAPPTFDQTFRSFRDSWQEYGEREWVRQLLARNDGNVAQAARAAEIDRTYLYKLIRKYFR
jgi:two-component system, NtrC family, response regulator GlrR